MSSYLLKNSIQKYNNLKIKLFLSGLILFFPQQNLYATNWQTPETSSPWKGVWGQPGDDAIYVRLWTLHLRGTNTKGNADNKMLGMNLKGIFFGSFINTFYKRSYAIGVERVYYSQKFNHYFQFDGGYRLGLLWGYKDTTLLTGLAQIIPNIKKIEPLPFAQLTANLSWEMLGVQFSYCFVIVSVGFFIKI